MKVIIDTGILFRGNRILLEVDMPNQGEAAYRMKYEKDHFKDLIKEVLKNTVGEGQVEL